MLLGAYPDLSAYGIGDDPDFVRDTDLALISAPIDALGVNYYAPAGCPRRRMRSCPSSGSQFPATR